MKRVPGTRDIFSYKKYIACYTKLRETLSTHNFEEIHTPLFEEEEVFLKNIGEQTDVISKEIYYVTDKHSTTEKRKVLRPELTAPIMRAYFENKIQEAPWHVFQIGEAFRHERPQKGRYREFFQCSIESINAPSVGHDVALLSILFNFFKNIIERTFTLEINYIGSLEERNSYKQALHFFCQENKILKEYLSTHNITDEGILKILDTKNEDIKNVLQEAPSIKEYLLEESVTRWHTITETLTALEIPYTINTRLVRGLDYYNGLVFEFKSEYLGAQDSFCGGGRYDYLSKNFSSKEKVISALGAGIGIDRVLLLQEKNKLPPKKKVAIVFSEKEKNNLFSNAILVQKKLAKEDIPSEIFFDKESLKSSLKKAHNKNFFFAIIINEETRSSEKVILKFMQQDKEQYPSSMDDIISVLKKNIEMSE
jgi:histidyl-tRNA synthetase